MEEENGEQMDCKEGLVANITLYGPVREGYHSNSNSLLVHLEVDESRRDLISGYERRLDVVDMLEEIVEWLRESVWVGTIDDTHHIHVLKHHILKCW